FEACRLNHKKLGIIIIN
uniref:Uncharacterized protein n=1 Tax=Amphimedon queenslandica TaxID=400682 RepID=A0A1X7U7Y3_AMPQE